ncbi:MAG TPA: anthranilate phosphoribosyltransferase [Candidatus Bilamarchaeaceae archaeon]|nr:anthranilate phosphoribosyltransferase [Candidatus Bilamarchaeaceae archaeon]
MRELIKKLINNENLDEKQAEYAINKILKGECSEIQVSSFLTALRIKGETVEELAAFAKVMRSNSIQIHPKSKYQVDTCGTGGDGTNTFNISTTAMFVAAGAGCSIAKHGNRSVSSSCGSADLLEGLGVKIDLKPDEVEKSITKVGIGFMLAPLFHPTMKNVMNVRKELGVKTVFNILGPLTNPASTKNQLIGVFDEKLTEKVALVLKKLKLKHALVVHGSGLDEICLHGKTIVSELKNNEIKTYEIQPEDFGFERKPLQTIQTNGLKENVQATKDVLEGKNGPHRDIVLLNAGTVIYVSGIAGSIKDGIKLAKESIDSGKAKEKLNSLIRFSSSLT